MYIEKVAAGITICIYRIWRFYFLLHLPCAVTNVTECALTADVGQGHCKSASSALAAAEGIPAATP